MSALYALLAASLFGCAVYMILSRNVVRLLLGLSMLATAVNLMVFLAGHLRSVQPPLIPEGSDTLRDSADPVTQALILTAIVIGFALTVVLSALSLRAYRGQGTLDTRDMRSAERLGNPSAGGADGDR